MSEVTMGNSLRGEYSPMESTIFAVLQRGPATNNQLVRPVYPRKREEPFNAQIVINRAVTTLWQKLKYYREPFRLKRRRLPRQRLIENSLVRSK